MADKLAWQETRFMMVPLTETEIRQRGEQLARAHKNATELSLEHEKQKRKMKADMDEAEGQISRLATIVNDRQEERSVSVEIRINIELNMAEEVNLVTGEVIRQRDVTKDDKARLQKMAQEEMFKTDPPAPAPAPEAAGDTTPGDTTPGAS
jgi:hypothetical protein